jgi:hypothetical protein
MKILIVWQVLQMLVSFLLGVLSLVLWSRLILSSLRDIWVLQMNAYSSLDIVTSSASPGWSLESPFNSEIVIFSRDL